MLTKTIETMKREMQDVVQNNILRFWLDRMQDDENGGFYGRIDADGVLHKDAEKGAILNARILWSFSAAYRVFSGSAAASPAASSVLGGSAA
jgi:mannobiose 2-epimerase